MNLESHEMAEREREEVKNNTGEKENILVLAFLIHVTATTAGV